MDFRIAETFTDSLIRLTGEEQKAVKTTAFDLQMNPESPGLSFHKLDVAKDKNFWSVRVSGDLRLIVHKAGGSILLCYVDHHDKAYEWARRRRLETHPQTGAAQIVEIRETVREVVVPVYVAEEIPRPSRPPLFASKPDDELLSYGVPLEWLADVREVDEDGLLTLAEHLPGEAAEALLELATGGKPRMAKAATPSTDPFDHPDALRRFRVMTNVEELQRALDYPWEKWTIFLHPEQREWVERDFSGPARVSGSAGTGKTIVALHRAVHLARVHLEARVLLVSFSEALANALHTKLKRLIGNEPRLAERIDIHSFKSIAMRLYKAHHGPANIVSDSDLQKMIVKAASEGLGGHRFSLRFLLTEWEQVVDAWQLRTWESYRDVARLGRKTRLPETQRAILWSVFEEVHSLLQKRGLMTQPQVFTALASTLLGSRSLPFDFAVVDEAQDISVAQLRFLAALGGTRPNALFFAGDLGQRIFQQPFSWKSLGVDVRGRSRNLRINYRTSHQIRQQADRLLGPEMIDVDGNTEDRTDTISVFNGPAPVIRVLESEDAELILVGTWLAQEVEAGVMPHEIGVFVRSAEQLGRAEAALRKSDVPYKVLDEHVETTTGHVSICTMHLAKGLEFRAVAVMACDDEVIPLQERIETVVDEGDLEEVYNTERHLLYVACTRARDHLLVTSASPASEFLDDMRT
ncbi:MAG: 3'-5' exonuclease [Dehalococcoidia bacterium]